MPEFRDRVVDFVRVPASSLVPHERNWRVHGRDQVKALKGILDDVGFAGAVMARRRDDGKLELIDGHLRTETMGVSTLEQAEWSVPELRPLDESHPQHDVLIRFSAIQWEVVEKAIEKERPSEDRTTLDSDFIVGICSRFLNAEP